MLKNLKPDIVAAIELLEAAGFEAFTAAYLGDVVELRTGARRRTFRNQGRYELVLALRSLPDEKMAAPKKAAPEKKEPVKAPVVKPDLSDAVVPNNHVKPKPKTKPAPKGK